MPLPTPCEPRIGAFFPNIRQSVDCRSSDSVVMSFSVSFGNPHMRSYFSLLSMAIAAAFTLASVRSNANLIGYWAFENSAQIGQDSSGNSFHLNAVGTAVHTASGRNGGGLSVNGAGAYLTGAVSALPIGNSPYTIAAWIRPTVAGDRGIVGWGNFGG